MNVNCSNRFMAFTWFALFIFLSISFVQNTYGEIPAPIQPLIDRATDKGMMSGSGAVILDRQISISVDNNGYSTLQKRLIAVIIDQKAIPEYSQISFTYNEYFDVVSLDYARTYGSNRAPLTVSNDAVQIKTPQEIGGANSYSDIRSLTFSLPGLAPGVVFEYQITLKSKPRIIGNWDENISFHEIQISPGLLSLPRIDPVLKSSINVDSPSQKPFKSFLSNVEIMPVVKKDKDRKRSSWTLEGLSSVSLEPSMPSLDLILPNIILSSFSSWKQIEAWVAERFMPNCIPNDQIRSIVHSITKNTSDRNEMIHLIYKYVQSNIEYVRADIGRSGYQPHQAGQVLQSGYGDCKDQTVLVISMLKVLGIEAFPALLVPFPQKEVNTNIPSLCFTHAIVYIPQSKNDKWIDTTTASKFPNLFWMNQNRLAMIIDGKGGHFLKTPNSDSSVSRGSVKTNFHFDDNQLVIDLELSASGAIGDTLKSIFAKLQPQQQQASLAWTKQQYPNSELSSFKFSDMKDSDALFEIKIVLKSNQKLDMETELLPFSFNMATTANTFSKLFTLSNSEDRKFDYVNGFTYQLDSEWKFSPPNHSFSLGFLPEGKEIDSKYLSYELRYSKDGDLATVNSSIYSKSVIVEKNNYDAFYSDIQNVIKNCQGGIVYRKQKTDKETKDLENRLNDMPENIGDQINLSKRYLKAGRYDEALNILRNAAETNKANGELFYYLGIALGYVGDYDSSSQAFETAKNLGYAP